MYYRILIDRLIEVFTFFISHAHKIFNALQNRL